MRCIRIVFRTEVRRRLGAWVALAVLIALVGGTVLAGVSAARRTSSAFPQFVSRYGFDAGLFSSTPSIPGSIAHMGDVRSMSTSSFYANGNVIVNGQFLPANDLSVFSLPAPRPDEIVKLIGGRLPVGRFEALAGFSMQQQFGLHLGSIVTVPLYAPSQRQAVFTSNGTPTPHGPLVSFRIVGFETSMLDFPSGSPSFSMFTSPAFDRTLGRNVVAGSLAMVRLLHGAADLPRFTYAVNHIPLSGGNFVYPQSEDAQITAIEGSIRPQAIGWWLFALLAGLAGMALVGQALSRQSIVEREMYTTLSALGFRPNQLFGLGVFRAAAIGVTGMVGALAFAVAVSPLTPVGEARAAEPTEGFLFDALVFGLGTVAIVAVVLLLAAYPSWRDSRVRATLRSEDRPAVHGPSRVVRALAETGAPPSILIGTRHALERGRGRSSVPVATALAGAVVAVAALVATTVFGASLSNLLATPRLYGLGWQVDVGGMTYRQVTGVVTKFASDPAVTRITYGVSGKYVNVNGSPVQATLVEAGKGALVFSLIDGRYPRGDGEIALGTQTLSAAHAHVGSRVSLSVIGPSGNSRTSEFTVVGSMAFPPNLSPGGLGVGAVLPLHAAAVAACPTGPASGPCIESLFAKLRSRGYANWGMAIATAPDAAGTAAKATLERQLAQNLSVLTVPVNLVNFGQAVNFPAFLGVTLALFGAATLGHLLLVSVVRRRREIALLKVLGFVRIQVGTAVCWQATTVALIGIALGVPTGLAIGAGVWNPFILNLGAVPVAVVPAAIVALLAGGVVAFANLLAIVPAAIASRRHPAEVLREA